MWLAAEVTSTEYFVLAIQGGVTRLSFAILSKFLAKVLNETSNSCEAASVRTGECNPSDT